MTILRMIVCALALLSGVEAIRAAETVTVAPRDTGQALINPGMGWTMHFYSNVPRNYGSKLTPSDTLDDFPGVSTGYLRLPWAYLEPEEGQYNWAILDTPAQRWIAKTILCCMGMRFWQVGKGVDVLLNGFKPFGNFLRRFFTQPFENGVQILVSSRSENDLIFLHELEILGF